MGLNFAVTRYSIKDIAVSEISKKDRINDLRKKTDILIIDDEKFIPQSFLEKTTIDSQIKKMLIIFVTLANIQLFYAISVALDKIYLRNMRELF